MEATLYFDPKTRAVIRTVKNAIISKEFRKFLADGLELIKTQKATKELIDITEMGVMSVEDQRWLQQEYYVKAVDVGLRHQAFLIPKDVFAKVALQRTTTDAKLNQQIIIQYFNNKTKALEWLESVN